ncbi:hypothetical protein TREES_T100011901 [Tupaia chinensis]|uniref:Uncharacterized protein n=1 Tax=Tupaia chinensis TaxID=246437 RepID=L9KT67_TUPCH|nr:hypothetical protein TREES_T100011901 [Tupaia chinensis]
MARCADCRSDPSRASRSVMSRVQLACLLLSQLLGTRWASGPGYLLLSAIGDRPLPVCGAPAPLLPPMGQAQRRALQAGSFFLFVVLLVLPPDQEPEADRCRLSLESQSQRVQSWGPNHVCLHAGLDLSPRRRASSAVTLMAAAVLFCERGSAQHLPAPGSPLHSAGKGGAEGVLTETGFVTEVADWR